MDQLSKSSKTAGLAGALFFSIIFASTYGPPWLARAVTSDSASILVERQAKRMEANNISIPRLQAELRQARHQLSSPDRSAITTEVRIFSGTNVLVLLAIALAGTLAMNGSSRAKTYAYILMGLLAFELLGYLFGPNWIEMAATGDYRGYGYPVNMTLFFCLLWDALISGGVLTEMVWQLIQAVLQMIISILSALADMSGG